MVNKKCKVNNCENTKIKARGYCGKHLAQLYIYGKILERTIFDKNKIIDCGDHYEICLYNIKHKETGRTLIDKEDLDKVKNYKWHLNKDGYVLQKNKKNIFLHHLIIGYPQKYYVVDHRDANPLNNRKSNLRFVTKSQNGMNRKSKGYTWDKNNKKWCVQISINGKHINLGRFKDEQIAKKVAIKVKKKYYKEFAYNK